MFAGLAAFDWGVLPVPASATEPKLVSLMETVRILGVPLRSGSLYPGTEDDAKGYRNAGLTEVLRRTGIQVSDDGDLEIPSYLPHHSIPPIRNWPGPRIVWDLVRARTKQYLQHPDYLPILLGCDCSVVQGTARALAELGDVHVIYIDGDFDDAPPDPATTRSGAAAAVWLLTNESPFYFPPLQPEKVTVVGWTKGPFAGSSKVGSISLRELRQRGPAETIRHLLQGISRNAKILVHFDIDVVTDRDLPAAYFPHAEGFSLQETGEIIDGVLSDERVRLMEISEYAILRDPDAHLAGKIANLLAHALGERARKANERKQAAGA
jgi:arginase